MSPSGLVSTRAGGLSGESLPVPAKQQHLPEPKGIASDEETSSAKGFDEIHIDERFTVTVNKKSELNDVPYRMLLALAVFAPGVTGEPFRIQTLELMFLIEGKVPDHFDAAATEKYLRRLGKNFSKRSKTLEKLCKNFKKTKSGPDYLIEGLVFQRTVATEKIKEQLQKLRGYLQTDIDPQADVEAPSHP
jgi:hypothetical protein